MFPGCAFLERVLIAHRDTVAIFYVIYLVFWHAKRPLWQSGSKPMRAANMSYYVCQFLLQGQYYEMCKMGYGFVIAPYYFHTYFSDTLSEIAGCGIKAIFYEILYQRPIIAADTHTDHFGILTSN